MARLPEFGPSAAQPIQPHRVPDASGFKSLFAVVALAGALVLVGLALLCGGLG